jgi:glycolate oxidase FAD binding subunit
METRLIDGFGPLPCERPASVDDLCAVVKDARAADRAIYSCGGQTMLDFGLPPSRPGTIVDTRQLSQVIDYPAQDMTITLQAGMTMGQLRSILSAEGQRLPVDVPLPDRATLGGALAVNASGPRRYGHGTLRDYLIGISVANDEGQEIKAGGRVVKNVAGYDLCKLYVGSLGTLGVITQATLKLKPIPEAEALLTFGCETKAIGSILEKLHGSSTRPVCIDLLNAAAVRRIKGYNQCLSFANPEKDWVAVIGFEDNAKAVSWQVRQLRDELRTLDVVDLSEHQASAADALWRALTDFPAQAGTFGVTFKANFLPSATAAICDIMPGDVPVQIHAGNGVALGHIEAAGLESVRTLLGRIARVAAGAHGNCVLLRCPTEWKATLPVWGRPRADYWLMRAVKEKLDPRRTFNPGRFVDGL